MQLYFHKHIFPLFFCYNYLRSCQSLTYLAYLYYYVDLYTLLVLNLPLIFNIILLYHTNLAVLEIILSIYPSVFTLHNSQIYLAKVQRNIQAI